MYHTILKPIIKSPQLPLLLKELNKIWEEEQAARQAFYDWVTPDIKAEFIEGEIIVHSPVRSKHNIVLKNILRLVDFFVLKNKLGYVGVEKIMCRFSRNDYEPDLCFFNKKKSQKFTATQTIFPVPDLIVEILSAGTKDRDRGVKYNDYEANGVQEYLIIDADIEVIELYRLMGKKYKKIADLKNGDILESEVLTNFKVPVQTIFDEQQNLKTLLTF